MNPAHSRPAGCSFERLEHCSNSYTRTQTRMHTVYPSVSCFTDNPLWKYFPKHPTIIIHNYLFCSYPVLNTVEKFIFHLCTVCLNLLPLQMSLNVTNYNSWYWWYTVIVAEIFFDDNLIQQLLHMKLESKFLMYIYSA